MNLHIQHLPIRIHAPRFRALCISWLKLALVKYNTKQCVHTRPCVCEGVSRWWGCVSASCGLFWWTHRLYLSSPEKILKCHGWKRTVVWHASWTWRRVISWKNWLVSVTVRGVWVWTLLETWNDKENAKNVVIKSSTWLPCVLVLDSWHAVGLSEAIFFWKRWWVVREYQNKK